MRGPSQTEPYKPKIPERVRAPNSEQRVPSCDRIPRPPPRVLAGPGNGGDIVGQLANKLKAAQEENVGLKVLLSRANEENAALKARLTATTFDAAQQEQGMEQVQQMQAYVKQLENQIYCLEHFLEQQGLVYIEEPSEGPKTQADVDAGYEEIRQKLDELKKEEPTFAAPDRDLLKQKIDKLNQIAGARAQMTQKDNVCTFEDRESVRVRFYPDGIFLNKGPFRRYTKDPTARQFADDIMAGFLPTEFRERYPGGVQIDAYYEQAIFETASNAGRFSGDSRALEESVPLPSGSSVNPQKSEMSELREKYEASAYGERRQAVQNAMDERYAQEKPVSLSEFLAKLPSSKVVNGRVINVRDQVAKDLCVASTSDAPLAKTAILELKEEAEDDGKLATIRIKINAPKDHRDGRNIVVKLPFSTPVSKLYAEIAKQLGTAAGAIQLIKVLGGDLEQTGATIEVEGLTPNARLYCKLAV